MLKNLKAYLLLASLVLLSAKGFAQNGPEEKLKSMGIELPDQPLAWDPYPTRLPLKSN